MLRTLAHTFHHKTSAFLPSRVSKCTFHFNSSVNNKKPAIDYSRVPILNEHDLEEQFVRGSGPGGQAVNKTNNCVVLKHKPTGIIVKCHAQRMTSSNQKEARKLLIDRLDAHINGDLSVENQMKRLELKKSTTNTWKRKKIDEMKKKWKERENIE